jgi:hypothetical protein
MTVKNLIEILEKYPPNMRTFAYDAEGRVVEVDTAELLPGDDEVWHEKQGEDVLLIS